MNRLTKEGHSGSFTKIYMHTCKKFLVGMITRKPFGKTKRADQFPLQLIHSDICGPINVRARFCATYFITLNDNFTCFGSVYLISPKVEEHECFKTYTSKVKN